ncbi:hypothetical protein WJ969_12195 [Achromobacter xylosoxidans]
MRPPAGIRHCRLYRSQGRAGGAGALLLAYHDEDGGLVYAGKVGTGFDDMAWRRCNAA